MDSPPVQKEPAGHTWHAVAPGPLKVPLGQMEQLVASVPLLYHPASQYMHWVVFVTTSVTFALPAGQEEAVPATTQIVAPGGEPRASGQGWQSAAAEIPGTALKVFAGQGVGRVELRGQ